LFEVIFEKLKPIFEFDDAVIVLYNDNLTHSRHLISDTADLDRQDPTYQQLFSEAVPVADSPFEELAHYSEPRISPASYFVEKYPHHWGVQFGQRLSLVEHVHMPMRYGGKLLGIFEFHSKKQGRFSESQMPLFRNVADQVAVAVANILANEEILEREREKSQLLKISETISTIRDAHSLFSSLSDIIRSIIAFDEAPMVFLLDEQQQQYRIFYSKVFDLSADLSALKEWQQGKNEISSDPVARYLIEQNRTLILSTKQAIAQWSEFPAKQTMLDLGLAECLVAPLRVNNNLTGFLCVWSLSEGRFKSQLPLFQSIADQVAVAVANILANEEILEREREKSLLLSLSEDMATIRDRNDLWRVMREKIGSLVPFIDAVVAVYSPDKQFFWHLLGSSERWPGDGEYQSHFQQYYPVAGSPAEYLVNRPGNFLWTTREVAALYPDFPTIPFMLERGYHYNLHLKLNWAGNDIGYLHFHFDQLSDFGEGKMPFYKSIADQVAVAVANILANEEILQREREKTTLLSISEQLATIRDKQDLFSIIFEKLRPVFNFDDAVVVLYDAQSASTRHFTHINSAAIDRTSAPAYNEILTENIPLAGTPYQEMAQLEGPRIVQMEYLLQHYQDHIGVQTAKALGLIENTFMPLRYGGQLLGFLEFHAKAKDRFGPHQLPLFRNVADQVAVAVANILANEEILEREREKALLLSLSEDMATIRDREDLWQVMMEKIRPLVDFDDAVVAVYSKDKRWTNHILTVSPEARQANPNYEKIVNHPVPIPNSPIEYLMQREGNFLITTQEFNALFPDHPGIKLMQETGLQYTLHYKLIWGGDLIGQFHFHFSRREQIQDAKLGLYKAIADQVAVAVANILANEEILERELEKSLQVALINALTGPRNWEEKLLKAALVLQAQVPFDYLIIGLEERQQEGRAYGFYRTGESEYQTIRSEDFFRLASLTPEKYAKLRQGKHYGQALVLNGKDFESHCRQNGLKKIIAQTLRLQSNLLFPLSLTRAGRFVLSFFSRQPQSYRAHHLALLEKLQGTLSITLDRLLAYEEIEGLSRQLRLENTYLAEEIKSQHNFGEMIGGSPAMQQVFEKLSLVAPTYSTVLILGETGTGKELVARALHNLSDRKSRPLIKVNCAALPRELIESELFGHEKGAFTGAIERRIGKFELAHQSTIFLDEIGELPPDLQAKLLRVLQEKEIERLGGRGPIKTDVRIVAATNRNLEGEVAAGRFRADLYYRLNVFPITLPPLRERKPDILPLAEHFARKFSKSQGKPFAGFSPETLAHWQAYAWPGNIRELENAVEQATIWTRDGILRWQPPVSSIAPPALAPPPVAPVPSREIIADLPGQKNHLERQAILNALVQCKGRISGRHGAASLLGLKRTTLEYRMKVLGITKKDVFLAAST
jgi:transcriptional regulator with GAF, ATPase, and Fis domain